MARTTVNTKDAEKAFKKRFKKASQNKTLLKEIGEISVKNSVADTRLGKDPETQENFERFKDSSEYGSRRSQIAKSNGRGRSFKPSKANMTLTGQLLNAIQYKIKGGKVIMDVAKTSRKKYGNEKKVPNNKQLASWHKAGAGSYAARNILGVSEKTLETIKNKVRAFLRRNLLKR